MITWNDILLQYQFKDNSYEEHSDPSDLKNYFVEVIPKYRFQALNPKFNHVLAHSYYNMLLHIFPSDDILYDFPVSVIITYLSSHYTGRQFIYFSNIHSLLCLYTHLDFIKMHMHNAILLGKAELTIDLPAEYFVSPKHLFIFCGSLNLYELCDYHDTDGFDYHLFLFAASSYLMINDSFLVNLHKLFGSVNYKESNTLLPALYSLLTLNFVVPRTLV